jgi:hypothetical protein
MKEGAWLPNRGKNRAISEYPEILRRQPDEAQ